MTHALNPSTQEVETGARESLTLRPAWNIWQVPRLLVLHRKALTLSEPSEIELTSVLLDNGIFRISCD